MLPTRIRHAKRRSRSYSPRDHASTIRLTAYLGVLIPEEDWHHLLAAMRREDLRNDPRFKTNADRVAHMDETDALVGAWTQTLGKMEVFTITKEHRIPCAPVRGVDEVMHDAHMHERGMLEWIDHDEIGQIVVPNLAIAVSWCR